MEAHSVLCVAAAELTAMWNASFATSNRAAFTLPWQFCELLPEPAFKTLPASRYVLKNRVSADVPALPGTAKGASFRHTTPKQPSVYAPTDCGNLRRLERRGLRSKPPVSLVWHPRTARPQDPHLSGGEHVRNVSADEIRRKC